MNPILLKNNKTNPKQTPKISEKQSFLLQDKNSIRRKNGATK
jgi:hypothetical protein